MRRCIHQRHVGLTLPWSSGVVEGHINRKDAQTHPDTSVPDQADLDDTWGGLTKTPPHKIGDLLTRMALGPERSSLLVDPHDMR